MSTVKVTDQSFEKDVLNSDKPVLVDFWADWCDPCKSIAPILEELSESMSDQMTVAKIDIVDNPHTPTKFGVRGIPTLMLFKNGELKSTRVGAMTKSNFQEWLETEL